MRPPAARRLVLLASPAVATLTALVAWSAGGVALPLLALVVLAALAPWLWVAGVARRRPAGS